LDLAALAVSAETAAIAEFVAIAETAVPAITEAAVLDVMTEDAHIVEAVDFVEVAQTVGAVDFVEVAQIAEVAVSVEVAGPVELAVLVEVAVIVVTAGYCYTVVQAFPIQLWVLVAALWCLQTHWAQYLVAKPTKLQLTRAHVQ